MPLLKAARPAAVDREPRRVDDLLGGKIGTERTAPASTFQDRSGTIHAEFTGAAARSVTLKPKCYVFVCSGCQKLANSQRSDALTCSPACRVQAHRSGSLRHLRAQAKQTDVRPGDVARAAAVHQLRPDLAPEVMAGRMTLDEANSKAYGTYIDLVFRAAGAL